MGGGPGSSSCSGASDAGLGDDWCESASTVPCEGRKPVQPSDGGSSCYSARAEAQPGAWIDGLAVGACVSLNPGTAVYQGRWQGAPVAIKVRAAALGGAAP